MDQHSSQRTRRIVVPQVPVSVDTQAGKRDYFEEEYEDEVWPSRIPSSVRRYQSDVKMEIGHAPADVQSLIHPRAHRTTGPGGKNVVPARRTAAQSTPPLQTNRSAPIDTEDIASGRHLELFRGRVQSGPRFHWLLYVGIALFIMTVGWIVLSGVTTWWQTTQDDWHYGRPRTFQMDQVVGHGDSTANPSHFIALNLNRHVQVIEFPGGDSTKAKVYLGPVLVGDGQDLAAITLTFKDVNGDGKLDMIVIVQDSRLVFINDNGQFRTPHSGENIQS